MSTSSPLPRDLLARMTGVSLRDGCPVAPEDLRLITFTHWDLDGRVRTGELVIHGDLSENLRGVMAELFALRFPIECAAPACSFGGDDETLMRSNVTSAFNHRWEGGSKDASSTLSMHSFGRAIDVNPELNPFENIEEAWYAPCTDRSAACRQERLAGTRPSPGVLTNEVVAVFTEAGWQWGGDWPNLKDYHHFFYPLPTLREGQHEL